MKAHELLSSHYRWTQGAFARDAHGRMYDPMDERSVCWCVLGAIERCYPDIKDEQAARQKVADTITDMFFSDPCNKITNWNDQNGRTYEEVLSKLKEVDV